MEMSWNKNEVSLPSPDAVQILLPRLCRSVNIIIIIIIIIINNESHTCPSWHFFSSGDWDALVFAPSVTHKDLHCKINN